MQPNNALFEKLPKELQKQYKNSRKNPPQIEALKVATALKLWKNRGFRDIQFEVPLAYGEKTVFVKVLAKNEEGKLFGIECASTASLKQLRKRIERLRGCLPPDSYIIAVFPLDADKKADKAAKFVDEAWVTDKNGKVAAMIFMSFLGEG